MEPKPSNPEQQKILDRIPDFVSFSAELMAAIRAWETQKSDRLFEDHWAANFASPFTLNLVAEREKKGDGVLDLIALRTRFFDDFLLSAISDVKQVVLLAAGLDVRAFRLPFPAGTRVYELDKAEVLAKKHRELGDTVPNCDRVEIAVDFTQPWIESLLENGYQPAIPSVWMMEGLLMYLTEAEVRNLLQIIWKVAAPGSHCAADLLNLKALESDDLAANYWRSGFDDPEEIFTSIGWSVNVIQPQDFGVSFDRVPYEVPPREVLGVPRSWWVRAKK